MAVIRISDPGFLDGAFKSRSFADALAGSSSNGCFPELKRTTFCGLPSLWISDEDILALAEPFQYALVGFFPSRRPSLDAIRSMFGRPLKVDNTTSVGSRPSVAHVLVELDISKNYLDKVWIGPDNFRGECRTLSSAPMNIQATSNNPLSSDGNATTVLENAINDGNVVATVEKLNKPSSNLCPVASNIEMLPFGGKGVENGLEVMVDEVDVQ
ncbi:hypothetical protein M5K25_012177 [Dendrobium thyrsiflorum]|uniref:Uncharacterized protein n=1 Tax=Dendrobium thyrsiflorum TaxID=117978 RepID=A0ABD0UWT4_DENTH